MSVDFIPEKQDMKLLQPFKFWTITNFPFIADDFDQMTYYELLCKVVEYIKEMAKNENAIINNENALYNAYIQLQDYVNNYFDNLDVQDEINNKLDEMVEDGTLEAILLNYVNTPKVYDTTENMISDYANLVDGEKIMTLGYSSIGDLGASEFIITDTVDSTKFQIALTGGLYATMIQKSIHNIREFGGKNNEDITTILNKIATSNMIKSIIVFNNETYIISDILDFSNPNFIGNGATIKATSQTTTREHQIHFTGHVQLKSLTFENTNDTSMCYFGNTTYSRISDCKFFNNNARCNGYVDLYTNNKNFTFENCIFNCNSTYRGGIWVRENGSQLSSDNILFLNCSIAHNSGDEAFAVFNWNGKVNNVTLENCKIGDYEGCTSTHFISITANNVVFNNCEIHRTSNLNTIGSLINTNYTFNANYNPNTSIFNNCKFISNFTTVNALFRLASWETRAIICNNCYIEALKNVTISTHNLIDFNNCKFKTEYVKNGGFRGNYINSEISITHLNEDITAPSRYFDDQTKIDGLLCKNFYLTSYVFQWSSTNPIYINKLKFENTSFGDNYNRCIFGGSNAITDVKITNSELFGNVYTPNAIKGYIMNNYLTTALTEYSNIKYANNNVAF